MLRRLVVGAFCGGAGWVCGTKSTTLTVALFLGAAVLFVGDLLIEAGGGLDFPRRPRR